MRPLASFFRPMLTARPVGKEVVRQGRGMAIVGRMPREENLRISFAKIVSGRMTVAIKPRQ